jgi:hypothetical protein
MENRLLGWLLLERGLCVAAGFLGGDGSGHNRCGSFPTLQTRGTGSVDGAPAWESILTSLAADLITALDLWTSLCLVAWALLGGKMEVGGLLALGRPPQTLVHPCISSRSVLLEPMSSMLREV